jgi:hypothetical protein
VKCYGEGEVQTVDQLSGHRESPVSRRAREKNETNRSENMNQDVNHFRPKNDRATGVKNKGLGQLKSHAIQVRNDNFTPAGRK